jgi:hypothetical protein
MFCKRAHELSRSARAQRHTHLGEALAQRDLVALLDKVAQRVRVGVGVAGREALVGHVEEGEVVLLLDHLGDALPVLARRVDTGRVVRAGV